MAVDTKDINKGLDRLLQTYKAARPAINKQGAGIVLESAKGLSPLRTGNLKRSLRVETNAQGQAIVKAGPEAYYIKYVTGGTKYARSNPFMQTAYTVSSARVKTYMIEKLRALLQ